VIQDLTPADGRLDSTSRRQFPRSGLPERELESHSFDYKINQEIHTDRSPGNSVYNPGQGVSMLELLHWPHARMDSNANL